MRFPPGRRQFDQTACGRALNLLNVIDEFTRESLVMLVERSIDADRTGEVLERLIAERGAPELLRMDNGPEMTAHALQEWCELSKTGTAYIEPGLAMAEPVRGVVPLPTWTSSTKRSTGSRQRSRSGSPLSPPSVTG